MTSMAQLAQFPPKLIRDLNPLGHKSKWDTQYWLVAVQRTAVATGTVFALTKVAHNIQSPLFKTALEMISFGGGCILSPSTAMIGVAIRLTLHATNLLMIGLDQTEDVKVTRGLAGIVLSYCLLNLYKRSSGFLDQHFFGPVARTCAPKVHAYFPPKLLNDLYPLGHKNSWETKRCLLALQRTALAALALFAIFKVQHSALSEWSKRGVFAGGVLLGSCLSTPVTIITSGIWTGFQMISRMRSSYLQSDYLTMGKGLLYLAVTYFVLQRYGDEGTHYKASPNFLDKRLNSVAGRCAEPIHDFFHPPQRAH